MAKVATLSKPETEQKFTVPQLDSDPEYAAMIAQRDELSCKEIELVAEHSRQRDLCANITRSEFERGARAGALLDGGENKGPAPHQRCEELAREVYDIRHALGLLKPRIAEARQHASLKICDQLAPSILNLCAGFATHLLASTLRLLIMLNLLPR